MAKTQFVAFLRAINVGGRIVKMAELRKVFESLRLDDVSTLIASGNVIFTASGAPAALEKEIEAGLQRALKYPVTSMVRTLSEIAAVVAHRPFSAAASDGASLYVGFMKTATTPTAVKKTLAMQTEVDELRVHGREVYWLARQNISEATITMAGVEKALQTPVTFRNINTVRRLAAKYCAG